jgi:hypothetical protein
MHHTVTASVSRVAPWQSDPEVKEQASARHGKPSDPGYGKDDVYAEYSACVKRNGKPARARAAYPSIESLR